MTNTTEAILSAQAIVKGYGAQPVLREISLTVHEGERIGLVGRNGCGKSTLLKIMAGMDEPDSGLVVRRQGLRLGMLTQDCLLDRSLHVGEVLEGAMREVRALIAEYESVMHALADSAPGTVEHDRLEVRCAHLQHELELVDAWSAGQDIPRIAAALSLPDGDRDLATLSGGELRRVDLAATILSRPDVLLLDEPTNHIDTKSAEWVEKFLVGYKGSCVLVTHDRYFLEQVVSRIVEIEGSRLYSFPGNYARFLEYKATLRDIEERTEKSRQGILRRELAWLRRGAKARSTKQQARINRYHELAGQEGPEIEREVSFEIPTPPRLGKRILDIENIKFAYGDRVLFEKFSMICQKGMRVGIIGPSGCGKTTFLKALMGQVELKKGRVLIGETTQFLYVDQAHSEIDPQKTIIDFVSNGCNYWDVNGKRLYVPTYLERFLFDSDSVFMPMRNLSGGERNRIELAKKLLQGGNVLVLDEPTNDLDLPTLRILEEAVEAFDGVTLMVSHDRYFLNRLSTHLIVFEPNGQLVTITGNYDDYLIYKEKQAALNAEPKPEKAAPQKPKTSPPSNRLTYKEKMELEAMETTIESAEGDVARLEEAIHAPGFYGQNQDTVKETLGALKAAHEKIEWLYARWEELEGKGK